MLKKEASERILNTGASRDSNSTYVGSIVLSYAKQREEKKSTQIL
jgi:hypothetical protein